MWPVDVVTLDIPKASMELWHEGSRRPNAMDYSTLPLPKWTASHSPILLPTSKRSSSS